MIEQSVFTLQMYKDITQAKYYLIRFVWRKNNQ